MHRMISDLVSKERDATLIQEQILARWPCMAGGDGQTWLSNLLGQETVDVIQLEAESSNLGRIQDNHHWTV